jgi:hypothetical protein
MSATEHIMPGKDGVNNSLVSSQPRQRAVAVVTTMAANDQSNHKASQH